MRSVGRFWLARSMTRSSSRMMRSSGARLGAAEGAAGSLAFLERRRPFRRSACSLGAPCSAPAETTTCERERDLRLGRPEKSESQRGAAATLPTQTQSAAGVREGSERQTSAMTTSPQGRTEMSPSRSGMPRSLALEATRLRMAGPATTEAMRERRRRRVTSPSRMKAARRQRGLRRGAAWPLATGLVVMQQTWGAGAESGSPRG